MSEIDGYIELGEKKRGKRTIIVRAVGAKGEVIEEKEHSVPQGKHLRVHKGDEVRAGDRYGVMKFGSRMDVYLPKTSELRIKVGDVVRGGETVVAMLH